MNGDRLKDPLLVLLMVREAAIDQARRTLAGCLRLEAEAAGLISRIDAAVPRERAAADRSADERGGKEVFAAWSARARDQRAAAVAALAAAETQSARARADLAEARTAARAVGQLIDNRRTAARVRTETREAHALDDIARSRHLARMQNGSDL
jgi:hypothetical protein